MYRNFGLPLNISSTSWVSTRCFVASLSTICLSHIISSMFIYPSIADSQPQRGYCDLSSGRAGRLDRLRPEDVLPIDSPYHDMVEGTWDVKPWTARHAPHVAGIFDVGKAPEWQASSARAASCRTDAARLAPVPPLQSPSTIHCTRMVNPRSSNGRLRPTSLLIGHPSRPETPKTLGVHLRK